VFGENLHIAKKPSLPVKPLVPEDPSPPAAPPKFTCHDVYVPEPAVAVTFTDIAPVPEL
jgi:hypothetical protein